MNSELILEALKKAKRPTNILLNIFIGGLNYRKLKRRALYPTLPDFSEIKNNYQSLKKRKNNFYSLLSQLKKQGLLEKEIGRDKIFWKITKRGEERLKKIKNILHFPKINYKKEKDRHVNVIIFDIPEKRKSARNWLRNDLLSLGFKMLQKSVWIGNVKIPKEFFRNLITTELVDYIHIFQITKTGTIKKLKFE